MSLKEKKFVLFAMLSAFLICLEYAITRPASNALFLSFYSIQLYPWVWLVMVPLNFGAVYLYNYFLPRIGPVRVLIFIVLFSSLVNLLTGMFSHLYPHLIFFQFAWKDIYVLFMFKQLWSMIHGSIESSKAKYLYGPIYGVGTVGSIVGSFVPGLWAPTLGSEKILYLTGVVYALFLLTYQSALRLSCLNQCSFYSAQNGRDHASSSLFMQNPKPKEAFSLIRSSPILIAILGLVVFMQASCALMEYQFNAHLEMNILEKNARAAFYGQTMAIVNVVSLSLQFLGGVFLLRFLGLKKTHVLVPVLLCSSSIFSIGIPTFSMICFSFILLKGVEFSLFGVIREMLYVPLSLDEKYRAKAVIDVFAYRSSKALIALAILLLQSIAGSLLLPLAKYASIFLFLGWIGGIAWFFKNHGSRLEALK